MSGTLEKNSPSVDRSCLSITVLPDEAEFSIGLVGRLPIPLLGCDIRLGSTATKIGKISFRELFLQICVARDDCF